MQKRSTLGSAPLAIVAVVVAIGISSCGSDRGSEVTNPVAVEQFEADATPSQSATIQAACPTWVKLSGWYRSRKRNAICYYAEMANACSSPIYAYIRPQSTGVLVTTPREIFAYACHEAPTVGSGFRGQWAIGGAGGPKDPSLTGWYAYKGTEDYTPRNDPKSVY